VFLHNTFFCGRPFRPFAREAEAVSKCLTAPGGALLALALLSGTGCGDSKQPLYPAEGQVFFEKKPASGAVVWLHSVDAADPKLPKPHARVDKDGNFRLGTYQVGDGAPPGKYRVLIVWNEEVKSGDEQGKSLLPARYQNLEKSGLPLVEIKEGPNQLPPFYLTH
jgi:hypothetical protein